MSVTDELIAGVRALGCACNPDVRLAPVEEVAANGWTPADIPHVVFEHDDWCPLLRSSECPEP